MLVSLSAPSIKQSLLVEQVNYNAGKYGGCLQHITQMAPWPVMPNMTNFFKMTNFWEKQNILAKSHNVIPNILRCSYKKRSVLERISLRWIWKELCDAPKSSSLAIQHKFS